MRRITVSIIGLIWLLISAALLLVAMVLATLAGPASLIVAAIFALMGLVGLSMAALLIVRPFHRRRLWASAFVGSAFAIGGSAAFVVSGQGMVLGSEAILVFVAAASSATVLSASILVTTQ